MSRIIKPNGQPVLRIIIDVDSNGQANMQTVNPLKPQAPINVDLVSVAGTLVACAGGVFQQIAQIQARQKGIITNGPTEEKANEEPKIN